jgi:hypothetical protein
MDSFAVCYTLALSATVASLVWVTIQVKPLAAKVLLWILDVTIAVGCGLYYFEKMASGGPAAGRLDIAEALAVTPFQVLASWKATDTARQLPRGKRTRVSLVAGVLVFVTGWMVLLLVVNGGSTLVIRSGGRDDMVALAVTLGLLSVGLVWVAIRTNSAIARVAFGITGGLLMIACGLCVLLIQICSPVKS